MVPCYLRLWLTKHGGVGRFPPNCALHIEHRTATERSTARTNVPTSGLGAGRQPILNSKVAPNRVPGGYCCSCSRLSALDQGYGVSQTPQEAGSDHKLQKRGCRRPSTTASGT